MPQKPRNSAKAVQISRSVHGTEAIAAALAETLTGGECIALEGELGAGKTQFVRGLAKGLGVLERVVSSPTYVLLNVYPGGRLTVFHLDAYRMQSAEDFESVGFSELLEQNGVVVVEWASRIERLLPQRHIDVRIDTLSPTRRRITISGP